MDGDDNNENQPVEDGNVDDGAAADQAMEPGVEDAQQPDAPEMPPADSQPMGDPAGLGDMGPVPRGDGMMGDGQG